MPQRPPAAPPLAPQLSDLERQLEDASRVARALVAGLTEQELARRSRPGRWSVCENLAHLSRTTEAYLPVLDSAIAAARREGRLGEGPFRMDPVGWLLTRFLDAPPRLRVPTTARFEPGPVASPGAALPEFLGLQERLTACLHAADGVALDRVKIPSPVSRRVTYNLLSAFAVLAAHERRHLWQAERVRDAIRAAR